MPNIFMEKNLREIDRRVRYLTKRLEELIVVSQKHRQMRLKPILVALSLLRVKEGNKSKYRLVGPDEINPEKGYISIDSPLGKAVLGKK